MSASKSSLGSCVGCSVPDIIRPRRSTV